MSDSNYYRDHSQQGGRGRHNQNRGRDRDRDNNRRSSSLNRGSDAGRNPYREQGDYYQSRSRRADYPDSSNSYQQYGKIPTKCHGRHKFILPV